MTDQATTTDLSEATISILNLAYLRIQNHAAAQHLWVRLSPAEKAKLGNDLQQAYKGGGTIGMWMRLHAVDKAVAVAQAAYQCGFLNEPDFQFIMQDIVPKDVAKSEEKLASDDTAAQTPETLPTNVPVNIEKPKWDSERRLLFFRDQKIRRVRGKAVATNISLIVEAFHESGWQGHIDDPLPGGRDPQRLRETVSNLNQGLSSIRFRCDGSGEGVCWEPLIESPFTRNNGALMNSEMNSEEC